MKFIHALIDNYSQADKDKVEPYQVDRCTQEMSVVLYQFEFELAQDLDIEVLVLDTVVVQDILVVEV